MTVVDALTDALGRPVALREFRRRGGLVAAVGRWRHDGARLDLADPDTVRVVFNVSGGQVVELGYPGRTTREVIRAGSVAVVRPGHPTRVAVSGRADTVQVVVSRALVEEVTGREGGLGHPPPDGEPRLRAAAVRAFVALGRSGGDAELGELTRDLARVLSPPPVVRVPKRGGLSAAARRRVHALIDRRLRADGCDPLPLADLAAAAGLTVSHFVTAFRRTEGQTPYARVLGRRVDVALSLLLRPGARVDDVAFATGFSSPSHFVSTFRRLTGATPGAVRDAAR